MITGGVGFCMHVTVSVAMATSLLGQLGQLPRILVGVVFGAFPGAAIVLFVNGVMRPPMLSADSLPIIWLQITIMGSLICPVEYIDWRRRVSPPDESPLIRTRLHERLRAEPTVDIISMSMQDHYVEVRTGQGKELVLMRFSDAIKEVEGIAGTRLHRSHWVADHHLQSIEKRGIRSFAMVSDGTELPVSDTYVETAKEKLSAVPEQ